MKAAEDRPLRSLLLICIFKAAFACLASMCRADQQRGHPDRKRRVATAAEEFGSPQRTFRAILAT
jgi:hypothetical protein